MVKNFKVGDEVFFDDVFADKVNKGKIIQICKNNDLIIKLLNDEGTIKGNSSEFFNCEHCAELTHKMRMLKRQLKQLMNNF